MKEFKFQYGEVEVSHRMNLSKPINHEKILLQNCMRMTLIKKANVASGKKFWEMQVLYYDNKHKAKCDKYNLDDYEFRIKAKGDMNVEI